MQKSKIKEYNIIIDTLHAYEYKLSTTWQQMFEHSGK